jgi:predicted component of viral defense system (DUF524 family)
MVILESELDGTRIRLIPEKTYGTSLKDPIRSISYSQRPDLVFEINRPDGKIELVILDPKYKLQSETEDSLEFGGNPKKEDIDKMHSYRDSLLDRDGNRVVRYAGILYPGPQVNYWGLVGGLRFYPGLEEVRGNSLENTLNQLLL